MFAFNQRRSPAVRSWRSCALPFMAILAISAAPALAQQRDGGGRGQAGQAGVSQRGQNWFRSSFDDAEIDRLVQQVGLDETQQGIVQSLYQGFRSMLQTQSDEQRDKMRVKMEELREARDWQAMMSAGMTMGNDWQRQAMAMEQNFMNDVQGVLTEDQRDQWTNYQRGWKRRKANEGASQLGALSGERIDMYEMVDELDLPEPTRASLDPVLETYGIELEPAIDSRQRLVDSMTQGLAEGFDQMDPEKMESDFNALLKTRTFIRDLNERYLQLITANLSGEHAAALEEAYREQAFGGVYRDTRADRYFETIEQLDSLSDAQRNNINAIRIDFESQLNAVNAQLAAIQKTTEVENQRRMLDRFKSMAQGGQFGQRGGGGFSFEGQEERRTLSERKNELVAKTLTAVSTALTPDQLAQAPVPEERRRGGRGEFTQEQIEEFRARRERERNRDGN